MVGGPPPPQGVQLSMPPVVPIEPYEDLGACRYGGPYKRSKSIKNVQKITSITADKPLLERIPVEIICEICSNLSNEDLKKVVLCNRALNEVATPIMYKRSKLSTLKALFMWSEEGLPKDYAANVFLDPEKNKDADKKFNDFLAKLPTGKHASLVRSLEVFGIDSRTWQFGHELLRRFPKISDIGFPWIACHREFPFRQPAPPPQEPVNSKGMQLDSEEQRADRLITEFGETVMKNITQISFNWSSIATFGKILSHLPKLQKLYAYIPDPMDAHRALPYMDYKQIVPTIAATVGYSLVRLDLSRQPELAHIDDFIKPLGDRSKFPVLKTFNVAQLPATLDDKGSRLERAKFLYETCRASKCHGQWKFPHKNLQVDVLEMAELEAGQIKTLFLWLAENIPGWEGEFLMEEVSFLNPAEVIPKLEGFLRGMETIADAVPLKLRIDSVFPPTKKNRILPIVKKFASRLVQLTVSPSEADLNGEEGEDFIASTAKVAFVEWCNFLEAILPLCKNMHTFRTVSRTEGQGADIALHGKLEHHITALCRDYQLRHLDIDVASLLQPESLPGSALFDQDEPGDAPRVVIQGLAWMSTPRGSMIKPDFSNCLQNLRTLKMKNLFILRQVEMVWFTNLTAKLKNLDLIEIRGLVWHIGYDDGEDGSEDGAGDGDKSEDDEDEEWQDSEFGDEDEIPSMKEVSEQIGKLSLVNRLDADSSLLSWLPEDPESDSDSEPESGEGKRRLARGRVDDDDNDDDAHSTDSNFGSDPRFSKAVNEELRISRLGWWICRVLVETAKKTGGRCRKVVVKDLRIDAKGLDPWALEDSISVDDEEEWW